MDNKIIVSQLCLFNISEQTVTGPEKGRLLI